MRIDSHQHFWHFDPVRDSWITDQMEVIRRDFLPQDLEFILQRNKLDGCIAVQADQSPSETEFLVRLAHQHPFIKGVVGWVDLRASNIDELLSTYQQESVIKGFRHIVEGESDPEFLIRDNFQNGLSRLSQYGFTYDLLIRPRHYASTLICVANHPDQRFILDHIAKPPIKSQEFFEWASFISALAEYPNVYCKVSGLATEADWSGWKLDHFSQYLNHVFLCFGKERIMFGSDWPVCLLAASYEDNLAIVGSRLDDFTSAEKEAFWGLNAVKAYNL